MGCGPCTEDLLQLEATQEKNVKKSDDILLSAVALNANHCTDSKRCILLTVPVLIKKKKSHRHNRLTVRWHSTTHSS